VVDTLVRVVFFPGFAFSYPSITLNPTVVLLLSMRFLFNDNSVKAMSSMHAKNAVGETRLNP
jgi:hypothetical protein